MKLGYVIVYVGNVEQSLSFFEEAFGIGRRYLHESGMYGELQTGETVLAFASHGLGESNVPGGYVRVDGEKPVGMEVALVSEDVHAAHRKAVEAGAMEVKAPEAKPWGQVVSYVRCPDGVLVELCTPMGS